MKNFYEQSKILERLEDCWLTPDDTEEIIIGVCAHCGEPILEGDEIYIFEGELFDSKDCFCDWSGLVHVEYAGQEHRREL